MIFYYILHFIDQGLLHQRMSAATNAEASTPPEGEFTPSHLRRSVVRGIDYENGESNDFQQALDDMAAFALVDEMKDAPELKLPKVVTFSEHAHIIRRRVSTNPTTGLPITITVFSNGKGGQVIETRHGIH